MSVYCVYLTIYKGSLLPMFYIGSSSVKRVNEGYNGTVKSKKYGKVWNRERKNNRHLFKTKIISTYSKRKDALQAEYRLQQSLNVVPSSMYINMSYAAENGFFGTSLPGELNPCFGKKDEDHPAFGFKHSDNERQLRRERMSDKPKMGGKGENNGMFGKKHSDEAKQSNKEWHTGKVRSLESRRKQGEKTKGRKQSDDVIRKRAELIAKHYIVTFPDGSTAVIQHLGKFMNEHDLHRSAVYLVLNGKRDNHKGFKISHITVSS